MGFYNFNENIWACGFDTRSHRKQGNVTLISQSGAGMWGIVDVDERIDFNFAVSTGQELIISAEDDLDFALDQKETHAIGFFMETSRRPDKLIAAFVKVKQRKIPIVVIKVGRTTLSSQLAESHSGAMTDFFITLLEDNNAAFGAVARDRAPAGRLYSDYIGYLRDS